MCFSLALICWTFSSKIYWARHCQCIASGIIKWHWQCLFLIFKDFTTGKRSFIIILSTLAIIIKHLIVKVFDKAPVSKQLPKISWNSICPFFQVHFKLKAVPSFSGWLFVSWYPHLKPVPHSPRDASSWQVFPQHPCINEMLLTYRINFYIMRKLNDIKWCYHKLVM